MWQQHHLELFQYKHPVGTSQDLTPNNPGSSHIAYYVDDLRTLYDELKHAGVTGFVSPPIYLDQGPNEGGWSLYMTDPDGIPLELFQPPA